MFSTYLRCKSDVSHSNDSSDFHEVNETSMKTVEVTEAVTRSPEECSKALICCLLEVQFPNNLINRWADGWGDSPGGDNVSHILEVVLHVYFSFFQKFGYVNCGFI